MAITTKVWQLEGMEVRPVSDRGFELESQLEEIIFRNVSVLSQDWIIIGRQVPTGFGFVDLLALDRNGDVIVLELKKDRTPREVVAQVLDYGSWARHLSDSDIADIFQKFQEKYWSERTAISLNEYFEDQMKQAFPEVINSSHLLVVVAASMDDSSERIVSYLEEQYQVNINFTLLRTFEANEQKFLTRTWFQDQSPTAFDKSSVNSRKWNGEYYVSFGEGPHRSWKDAIRYGFISAGGGTWYSRTLASLTCGDRIWVNIPKIGYVGVGEVVAESMPANQAFVMDGNEKMKLTEVSIVARDMFHDADNQELCEYVIGVKWLNTVPIEKAIREVGLFGNQHSVCQPRSEKWLHTVDRLKDLLLEGRKAA